MPNYKHVRITIYERSDSSYAYTTDNGIYGCGQRSYDEALRDAKAAIDAQARSVRPATEPDTPGRAA